MNKLDAIMDFSKQSLPPVFKRQGKECYLDPIRDKLIYITPEETVRQWVLAYLINELHVPKDMILVEEHLSHYNIDSKRRVDIVINAPLNETELVALAVIECKAPESCVPGSDKSETLVSSLSFDIQLIDDSSYCLSIGTKAKIDINTVEASIINIINILLFLFIFTSLYYLFINFIFSFAFSLTLNDSSILTLIANILCFIYKLIIYKLEP